MVVVFSQKYYISKVVIAIYRNLYQSTIFFQQTSPLFFSRAFKINVKPITNKVVSYKNLLIKTNVWSFPWIYIYNTWNHFLGNEQNIRRRRRLIRMMYLLPLLFINKNNYQTAWGKSLSNLMAAQYEIHIRLLIIFSL